MRRETNRFRRKIQREYPVPRRRRAAVKRPGQTSPTNVQVKKSERFRDSESRRFEGRSESRRLEDPGEQLSCAPMNAAKSRVARTMDLWENGGLSQSGKHRSVGAAGAQVPYKHKVGGSNPSPTTTKDQARSHICSGLFQFQALYGNMPYSPFGETRAFGRTPCAPSAHPRTHPLRAPSGAPPAILRPSAFCARSTTLNNSADCFTMIAKFSRHLYRFDTCTPRSTNTCTVPPSNSSRKSRPTNSA